MFSIPNNYTQIRGINTDIPSYRTVITNITQRKTKKNANIVKLKQNISYQHISSMKCLCIIFQHRLCNTWSSIKTEGPKATDCEGIAVRPVKRSRLMSAQIPPKHLVTAMVLSDCGCDSRDTSFFFPPPSSRVSRDLVIVIVLFVRRNSAEERGVIRSEFHSKAQMTLETKLAELQTLHQLPSLWWRLTADTRSK